MKSPTARRLALSVLALTLLSGCANTGTKASIGISGTGDEESIQRLIQRRVIVTNRGDAHAFTKLFTPDAVIMPTNRANIVGARNIKQWESAFAEEYDIETDLTIEEIETLGDWAYVRLRVSGSLTPRLGGDPVPVNGKELAVLHRGKNGNWRIARLMGNSNVAASRRSLSPDL